MYTKTKKDLTPATRTESGWPSLFDNFFGTPGFPFLRDTYRSSSFPAMNIWEDENCIKVEAEVPGLSLEDLDITLNGRVLTIEGERRYESPADATEHRREIRYGSFRRMLTLPFEIESDSVKAEMKDGVLLVNLPKAEADRPKRIKVDVKRK